MLAPWRIEMFGRLQVSAEGYSTRRFQTHKAAALLVYLALRLDRPVTRDALAELLWPGQTREEGRRNLRQALHSLRNQLDSAVKPDETLFSADQSTVGIRSATVSTDVNDFLDAAKPRLESSDAQLRRLLKATQLYEEPMLPGFDESWAQAEREQTQEVYRSALARLASLAEAANEMDVALDAAKRLLQLDALQEEHHLLLIRLHALRGERTLALRQSEVLAQLLFHELGELPSAATLELIAAVESGDIQRETISVGVPEVWTVSSSRKREPAPLPHTDGPFFGRDAERERLRAASKRGTRVITLFGLGGSGKTRFALELAREQTAATPVAFVALDDLAAADQIPSALAEAIRTPLPPQAAPIQALREIIRNWGPGLIVLDSFERLGESALPYIQELLRAEPPVQLLVTSTYRTGLAEEDALELGPLPVPQSTDGAEALLQNPSVQLYLQRVAPKSTYSATELSGVAELCASLEGIPLAIELAAAWATGESQAPRSSLGGRPRRHRSLQAAIEYGFSQLGAKEREAFEALAILHGSWGLAAARAILPDADLPPLLAGLAERSFIREWPDAEAEAIRYSMLETLRTFGLGRHSDAQRTELAKRHREAFLVLACEGEAGLRGPQQALWLQRLENDLPNLLAALESASEVGDTVLGLKLATALTPFWEAKGPLQAGRSWLEKFLSAPLETVPREVRANAMDRLGWLAWNQADYPVALTTHIECLRLRRQLGDKAGIAQSLYLLGITSYRMGDLEITDARMRESLSLATEIGDDAGRARALLNLGNLANDRGDFAAAKSALEQSYQLEQALGNGVRAAAALNNLGVLAANRKQWVLATHYYEACLKRSRELGHVFQIGFSLLNLGQISRQRGKLGQALEQLSRSAEILRQLGQRLAIRDVLLAFGQCALTVEEWTVAATYLGASVGLNAQMNARFAPPTELEFQAASTHCRQQLSATDFEEASRSGRAMTHDEAIDDALAWARRLLAKASI